MTITPCNSIIPSKIFRKQFKSNVCFINNNGTQDIRSLSFSFLYSKSLFFNKSDIILVESFFNDLSKRASSWSASQSSIMNANWVPLYVFFLKVLFRNKSSNSSFDLIELKLIITPLRFVFFKIALIVLDFPQPGGPDNKIPALYVLPNLLYNNSPSFILLFLLKIKGVI